MAAYIIFDVEVTDPTAADDYLKKWFDKLTTGGRSDLIRSS